MKSSPPTRNDAAKSRAQVRGYFAKLSAENRKRLKQLADTIRKAAPGALDGFGYAMPSVKLGDKTVVWYAAWKSHLSLYPVTAADRRVAEAEGYKTEKGTIRFPLSEPLPLALVKRLVKSRVAALRGKKS